MKKSGLDIKKRPEGGYRIGPTAINPFAITYAVCQTILGILMLALCLWVKPAEWTVYLLFAGIFVGAPVLIFVPLIICSAGGRFEIDDEGVHLCYTFRRPKTLRWEEIADWGITELWYSKAKDMTHMLYFSPAQVPCKGKYKQIWDIKGTHAVGFHSSVLREASMVELINFCREHLENFTPMFRSDYPLNRINDH